MKAKNLLVVFFILITMSSFATSNGLYTMEANPLLIILISPELENS